MKTIVRVKSKRFRGNLDFVGSFLLPRNDSPNVLVLELVLIVGPKLFIEPGAKAFLWLSSVSDPGL